MAGGRSYSSTTGQTTLTADPGTSGTTLAVADSTKFSSLDGKFPWPAIINLGKVDQEVVTVTDRPSGTTLTVIRGEDGTTGQSHAVGATVDHGISARDLTSDPGPQAMTAFGHSYFNWVSGTQWTTGRMDAMIRMAMDMEFSNWRNFANISSKLAVDGRAQGGWARVMQDLTRQTPAGQNVHGAPYFPDGGSYIFCWGINDIGNIGGSATQTQIRAAFGNALRAVIARARCSVMWDDNYTGPSGQPSYGAGWNTATSGTSDFSSGTTLHDATTTTSATVTLTLPSDYTGEPVVIQFVAEPGAAGGTVTFSGTAGVTGTLSTSNILPSASGTRVPVVKRITGLTSSNAGQTIICTVTAIDASGKVRFDYWGLESKSPVPVIVCNVPRILSAGYALYANTIGDSDVANLNTTLNAIVAEFDQMVQVADLDSALNKDSTLFASDGLHPNELGAARGAQACLNAVRRLVPTYSAYPTVNMTPSVAVATGLRIPRFQNGYYTAAFNGVSNGQTLTVGDLYAIPFPVTEGREAYSRIAILLSALGTGASSIRWGIYDDIANTGYPQCLWNEATSGGAFSLATTGSLLKENTGVFWTLDPGLWWIAVKLTVAGAGQSFQMMSGPDTTNIMPRLGSTAGATSMTANANPIAWKVTGQGTGALPTVFPPGASVVGTCPMVGLLKV